VNRALLKLNGVQTVDISLEKQLVNVKTSDELNYDTVLATIQKTGKKVNNGRSLA
jgi:copper chaperone CopZ